MKATRYSAAAGVVSWVVMAMVPLDPNLGFGLIERLFLLAPLVLVPLALDLAGRTDSSKLYRAVCTVQSFAAILVAMSFLLPQGQTAALLASPWLLVTVLAGLGGAIRVARCRMSNPVETCFAAGLLMLPVGGISLVQSRFGATPLGFHEPWVLLVAVHFHYAAFIAPVMAGAVGMRLVETHRSGFTRWFFRFVVFSVVGGSPLMASGFIFNLPWLRAVAAFLLSMGLAGQSMLTLLVMSKVRPGLAQALLVVSASSVIVAMWLAILFTLGDYQGEVWISIPQMARTHGIMNAFGFSLCGLLGWSLAANETAQVNGAVDQRRPQTLLSRWV